MAFVPRITAVAGAALFFGPLSLDGSALGDGLCVLFVVVMCV